MIDYKLLILQSRLTTLGSNSTFTRSKQVKCCVQQLLVVFLKNLTMDSTPIHLYSILVASKFRTAQKKTSQTRREYTQLKSAVAEI